MPSKFNISFLLILVVFIAGLASCARKAIPKPSITLDEPITVERNDKGHYVLKFDEVKEWSIYSGISPAAINWNKPDLIINGNEAILTRFPKSQRVFFGITDPDSSVYIVSERKIPLDGAVNFRDLGGIETMDGRVVNWGMLYRSNNLSGLDSKDLTYLNNLKIKTIGDFRYTSEIEEDPNKLPAGAKYYSFPIGGKEGLFYQQLKRRVLKEGLRRKEAKKEFIKVMELFADSAAHDFKPMMDLIADTTKNNSPLLYHCSGGKDRTGYMSMVILATLGVEKETIRNEYLMSNYYRYKTNKGIARKASLVGIDPETLTYILVVQDDYFDAVFNIIENKYGGIDNYLLEKYNITPAHRQWLIEKYTSLPIYK